MAIYNLGIKDKTKEELFRRAKKAGMSVKEYILTTLGLKDE